MPAIKKKWMKASHDEGANVNTERERKEDVAKGDPRKDSNVNPAGEPQRPVKRAMPQGPTILRRIDHGEVLQEKRKRFIPPAESKLSEWLDNNFEKRPDVSVKLTLMYKHYTELCQAAGSDILGVPEFNRMVKEKFGKTFGLQENSLYKAVLKERKITDKKAGGTGIKMKEIVHEAINHFGNPWHGVRFFTLKRYIATRYPALQIDMKPKLLKRSLEMGLNYGQIDLVKGVGMAGYYKIPGGEPPPKPEEKANKKDDETAEEEKKPEDKDENEVSKDESTEQAVKKKKLVKKIQPWSVSKIRSGNPRLLEDAFPLALTYQSAPKTASIHRIRRYIQEKYRETVTDNRWRQALESGVKKGYWEHISGSGITGTLHLQMDDFNPSSNQIEDMICAAIIACHEPKAASANQIKKYIARYHTEFGVDQRPDRFKKALQRAVDKKMIMQLTGLGAAGSYQLMVPFTPSPAMLAGEEDSDVEEEEDTEPPAYVPRGTKSRGMPKLKTMEVIRPTSKKARAGPFKKTDSTKKGKGANAHVSPKKNKLKPEKPKSKSKNSMKNGRKRAPSPLTDEEDDNDATVEYSPSKVRPGRPTKAGKDKTPKKSASSQSQKNKSKSPTRKTPEKSKSPAAKKMRLSEEVQEDSFEEEEEEDAAPEYTPRKSKSRGGGEEDVKSAGKVRGNKRKR